MGVLSWSNHVFTDDTVQTPENMQPSIASGCVIMTGTSPNACIGSEPRIEDLLLRCKHCYEGFTLANSSSPLKIYESFRTMDVILIFCLQAFYFY